jgi:hypothetical protein
MSEACRDINVQMNRDEYDEWEQQRGDEWHEENEPLCVKNVGSHRDSLDWSLCSMESLTDTIE